MFFVFCGRFFVIGSGNSLYICVFGKVSSPEAVHEVLLVWEPV